MITNAKQFNYLNAMGIGIWQQKDNPDVQQTNDESDKDCTENCLTVNLDKLCEQQLFIDLLQSLNVSLDQITLNKDHSLNIGLFNWQFTQNPHSQYQNNTLTTPAIEQLEQTPQLKRQLWQLLSKAPI